MQSGIAASPARARTGPIALAGTSGVFLLASLLFVALAWGPAAAHLLELPAKITLSRDDYLTVQQLYRGWALLGVVVAGALLSTGAFAWTSRHAPWASFAGVAFACVVGAQVVFWTLTFPTNQITDNWTALPDDWEALRAQWEYSHAAGASLNLVALIALLLATGAMLGRTRRTVEA